MSLFIPRRQFKNVIPRGLSEGDNFRIFFEPPMTGKMTKKQRKAQPKGWEAVVLRRYCGTFWNSSGTRSPWFDSIPGAPVVHSAPPAEPGAQLNQQPKFRLVKDKRYIPCVSEFTQSGHSMDAFVGAMDSLSTVKGRIKSIAKVATPTPVPEPEPVKDLGADEDDDES